MRGHKRILSRRAQATAWSLFLLFSLSACDPRLPQVSADCCASESAVFTLSGWRRMFSLEPNPLVQSKPSISVTPSGAIDVCISYNAQSAGVPHQLRCVEMRGSNVRSTTYTAGFDVPLLTASAAGDLLNFVHVAYNAHATGYELRKLTLRDDGNTWMNQTPQIIAQSPHSRMGSANTIAVDRATRSHVLYTTGLGELFYARESGTSWAQMKLRDGLSAEPPVPVSGPRVSLAIHLRSSDFLDYSLHGVYFNQQQGALKYIRKDSDNGAWSSASTEELIAGPEFPPLGFDVAVDGSGRAHVTYIDPFGIVMYAIRVAEGKWVAQPVCLSRIAADQSRVPFPPSVSIAVDSKLTPHISYYHFSGDPELTGELCHAWAAVSGCGREWRTERIDASFRNNGRWNDITVGLGQNDATVHLAYYAEKPEPALWYANLGNKLPTDSEWETYTSRMCRLRPGLDPLMP